MAGVLGFILTVCDRLAETRDMFIINLTLIPAVVTLSNSGLLPHC